MSTFLKEFLKEDPRRVGRPGRNRELVVSAGGKHPAWRDHMEPIGGTSESLRTAYQLIYAEGLAGRGGPITSGAWDRLPPEELLPAFDHLLVWSRGDTFLVGRLWGSSDSAQPPRTRYPFLAWVHGVGVSLDWALDQVVAHLDALPAACRVRDATEIDATVKAVWEREEARDDLKRLVATSLNSLQTELRSWLDQSSPGPLGVTTTPRERQHFLAAPEFGADLEGLRRVLYQARQRFAAYLGSARLLKGDPGLLHPQHLRVPACAEDCREAIRLWLALLGQFLPPDVPILLSAPSGGRWIDVLVGEPSPDLLFCLRATPAAMPMASDVPFTLDAESREWGEEILRRFRGEPPIPTAPPAPPASASVTVPAPVPPPPAPPVVPTSPPAAVAEPPSPPCDPPAVMSTGAPPVEADRVVQPVDSGPPRTGLHGSSMVLVVCGLLVIGWAARQWLGRPTPVGGADDRHEESSRRVADETETAARAVLMAKVHRAVQEAGDRALAREFDAARSRYSEALRQLEGSPAVKLEEASVNTLKEEIGQALKRIADEERVVRERAENERLMQARVEQARIDRERAERERAENERAEHQRAERERERVERAAWVEEARAAAGSGHLAGATVAAVGHYDRALATLAKARSRFGGAPDLTALEQELVTERQGVIEALEHAKQEAALAEVRRKEQIEKAEMAERGYAAALDTAKRQMEAGEVAAKAGRFGEAEDAFAGALRACAAAEAAVGKREAVAHVEQAVLSARAGMEEARGAAVRRAAQYAAAIQAGRSELEAGDRLREAAKDRATVEQRKEAGEAYDRGRTHVEEAVRIAGDTSPEALRLLAALAAGREWANLIPIPVADTAAPATAAPKPVELADVDREVEVLLVRFRILRAKDPWLTTVDAKKAEAFAGELSDETRERFLQRIVYLRDAYTRLGVIQQRNRDKYLTKLVAAVQSR